MLKDGKELELAVKVHFENLLEQIGLEVIKNRRQNSGTQDGFDNEIVVVDSCYDRKKIYIECKDYTKNLSYSEAIVKIPQIISSYTPDLLLFVSPHRQFSNPFNDTRLVNFYSEFKVPIQFLTPDNRVEELFALDKDLYQKIYQKEIDFEVNDAKILDRFEKIIFSSKPLKKIILKDSQKEEFIKNCLVAKDYIERSIRDPETSETNQIFNNIKGIALRVRVKDRSIKNGLVLLGNPGTGKTTELKKLAYDLWEEREQGVPYFNNISTFIESNTLEDYLPSNWEEYPLIYAIYDGVDEIQNASKFRTRLEKFVSDNNRNNIKFILSCRTNIYENRVKEITGFDCVEIEDLDYTSAVDFLVDSFGVERQLIDREVYFSDINKFMTIPYYLVLLGEYLREYNVFPTTKVTLIKTYIDKRLADDKKKLKNIDKYDNSLIIYFCKKVSLAMEAMQINYIEEKYLNILLGEDKIAFTNCCFVEKIYQEDKWKFEHRNIQEYFVAISLSNLSLKEILNFIAIPNLEKTHPSWLNSISYLLSILDKNSNLYKKIIDWLISHDYEVLFKADSNRISTDIKITVLQMHFMKKCKEEILWISNYNGSVKDIAKFGDCMDNFLYLLNQVRDIKNHRRARISALDLISMMNLYVENRVENLKSLYVELLGNLIIEEDHDFVANILGQIKELEFHKQDPVFFKKVIFTLGDYDYHRAISSILNMINEACYFDDYFIYVKNLVPKILGSKKRNYEKDDKFYSNEEQSLKEILLNFKEEYHLIYALEIVTNIDYLNRLKNRNQNIVSILVDNLIHNFSESLFDLVVNLVLTKVIDSRFYEIDKLCRFFNETGTNDRVFKTIYVTQLNRDLSKDFNSKLRYLVYLCDENLLKFIYDDFNNGNINYEDIKYFRNVLSNYNHDLRILFEKEIVSLTGYDFGGDVYDQEITKKWKYYHENRNQLEFDLLFDNGKLTNLVVSYFSHLKKNELTRKDLLDNKENYYNDVELMTKFPQNFLDILNDSFDKKTFIKIDDVKTLLEDEIYLMNKIYEILRGKNNNITVSEFQRNVIYEWCIKNIELTDFKKHYDDSSNSIRKLLIWFFRYYFKFIFSESVLLDLLFVDYSVDEYQHNKNLGYEYIFEQIREENVRERICHNLMNHNLEPKIFFNHAEYILDNNIRSYEYILVIKDFIKNKNIEFHYKYKLFIRYFEIHPDEYLLKELIEQGEFNEYYDDLFYYSLFYLILLNHNKYVIEVLLELLNDNDISDRKEIKIIELLIRANYSAAFKLLNNYLTKNESIYFDRKSYKINSEFVKEYSNEEALEDLIELLIIGLNYQSKFDKFREYETPLRLALNSILAICKASEEEPKLCLFVLNKVKDEVPSKLNSDVDKFYFSYLINEINDVYYNFKSVKLSFSEICKKIDELKYEL